MKAFRMSACLLAAALLSASLCAAQTFTGKAQSWVRGEFRDGALPGSFPVVAGIIRQKLSIFAHC